MTLWCEDHVHILLQKVTKVIEGFKWLKIFFPAVPGWVVLDRCGRHFGLVLNFLRDGSVPLPEEHRELDEVLKEAQYYRVQGLVQHCLSAMQVNRSFGFVLNLCKVHWVHWYQRTKHVHIKTDAVIKCYWCEINNNKQNCVWLVDQYLCYWNNKMFFY